jgi:hypothetical protein
MGMPSSSLYLLRAVSQALVARSIEVQLHGIEHLAWEMSGTNRTKATAADGRQLERPDEGDLHEKHRD